MIAVTISIRVSTVREKYLENDFFFQVREKSGNFVDGQGNLERTWNVSEKLGNLKINGYCKQSSENLFILFKRGMDVLSHEIVLSPSLLIGGHFKGKNLLPWEANLFFKSTPSNLK